MNRPLIFQDWRCRCSQLGKLLTNLPTEEAKQKIKDEIKVLTDERDLGVNANGNKVKWTANKEATLLTLYDKLKREEEDQLPAGAITYLEEEFRRVYWNRERGLENKYLTKGIASEDDALKLLSIVDGLEGGYEYWKNEESLQNGFIQGTPDNRQTKVKDTKCSWDLESFDNAELTTLYKWQVKGYMWLEHSYNNNKLETKVEGELCYCLLNNPYFQIDNALYRNKEKYFVSDDTIKNYVINHLLDSDLKKLNSDDKKEAIRLIEWYKNACQIERNMIYDMPAFKIENPHHDFYNTNLDFSIPAKMRVKRFDVSLDESDIKHITRRVSMARAWLIEKEKQTNLIRYGEE